MLSVTNSSANRVPAVSILADISIQIRGSLEGPLGDFKGCLGPVEKMFGFFLPELRFIESRVVKKSPAF